MVTVKDAPAAVGRHQPSIHCASASRASACASAVVRPLLAATLKLWSAWLTTCRVARAASEYLACTIYLVDDWTLQRNAYLTTAVLSALALALCALSFIHFVIAFARWVVSPLDSSTGT